MSAKPPPRAFHGLALDQGSLGFHLDFECYLAASAAGGFTHVEAPLGPLHEAVSPEALIRLLARFQLSIGTFTYPWDGAVNGAVSDDVWSARRAALPRLFAFARAAGATRVSGFFNTMAPGMSALSPGELAERLANLNAIARDAGVVFCAELNTVALLNTAPEILDWLGRDGDSIRLLVDAFHLYRFGLGPNWVARLRSGAIGWVHVADAPKRGLAMLDPHNRLDPGDGEIDLDALLKAVAANSYRGPISIEVPRPSLDGTVSHDVALRLGNAGRSLLGPALADPDA
ncbi:MAG: sugar phosphate isomerase/epimerase [Pseudomonadota bacterium]